MELPALAISGSNLLGAGSFTVTLVNTRGQFHTQAVREQREDLAILVNRLCQQGGSRLGEIREVIVDRGPGSYVGLRIAVTFARFVAAFNDARLSHVDSLQMIAAHWLENSTTTNARICPVLDGRGGNLHFACYELKDGKLLTISAAKAIAKAELCDHLQAGCVVLAAPDLLDQSQLPAGVSLEKAATPTAKDLLGRMIEPQEIGAERLEPLYLMGSYVD